MSPFSLITTHRITPGRAADLRALAKRYAAAVEAEPGAVALSIDLDDERGEITLVHVHADADAAEAHVQAVGPVLMEADGMIQPASVRVHGRPGPALGGILGQLADAGVDVRVRPDAGPGFARTTATPAAA